MLLLCKRIYYANKDMIAIIMIWINDHKLDIEVLGLAKDSTKLENLFKFNKRKKLKSQLFYF
jgi:hypothetical protein